MIWTGRSSATPGSSASTKPSAKKAALSDGRIAKSGDKTLAVELEKSGYTVFDAA